MLGSRHERWFMKNINKFLAVAVGGLFPLSALAIPLDISFTGGTPEGNTISASEPASLNIDGVNSIQVTWNAPAGYMYVVSPPPAGDANMFLAFELDYGLIPQTTSLGSVTASSVSVNTIFGISPLGGGAGLNNDLTLEGYGYPSLLLGSTATITPNTAAFGFTSITVSADFSGTGADIPLGRNTFFANSAPFGLLFSEGPDVSDPGELLTLEPLPGGSVPDAPSTFILAGMSFAGFWLCRRKLSSDNR